MRYKYTNPIIKKYSEVFKQDNKKFWKCDKCNNELLVDCSRSPMSYITFCPKCDKGYLEDEG